MLIDTRLVLDQDISISHCSVKHFVGTVAEKSLSFSFSNVLLPKPTRDVKKMPSVTETGRTDVAINPVIDALIASRLAMVQR